VLLSVWRLTEAGSPLRPLRDDEIVEDVESLVWGVIGRTPTTRDLSDADRDELFSALLERTVVLTRKYDPSRDDPRRRAPLQFRPWLFQRLRLAAIDELRHWHGRQGQKRVFDERLLDAARRRVGVDDGDPGVDRPDPATSEDASFAGALRTLPPRRTNALGDRERARLLRGLGVHEASRVA
jgi:hypothetical protein